MRFVLVSLLALYSFCAAAQQTQPSPVSPSHRDKRQAPADPKNKNTASSDGGARNSNTTFVLQESAQQNDESGKQPSYGEKVISPEIFPIWIASLVAIIGTVVAVYTLKAIEREAEEIRDVAGAATKNADATQKTVDTLMVGQRAWVTVAMGAIPNFTPDPNVLQFLWISPTFTNHGKTPGRIVRIRVREDQIPSGQQLPAQPIYEGVGITTSRFDGNAFLPPNASIQPITIGMVPAAFITIRQGNPVLYLYGFVDYLDVYNNLRTTRFCFVYNVQLGFNPRPEGFYIDGPASYNEAT